jgi:hypothetical protein
VARGLEGGWRLLHRTGLLDTLPRRDRVTRVDGTLHNVDIALIAAVKNPIEAAPGRCPRRRAVPHSMKDVATVQRTKPPFRADMVGSLLRTGALKRAREQHAEGTIDAAALKAVEDREIVSLIRKQEEIGLQAVTDGEFRRAYWHFDFLEHLDGVTSIDADSGMNFKGGVGIAKALRVTGPIGFTDHPMIEHFRFLKQNTNRVAKMTIPGPSMLHYRGGRKMINAGVYPDMDRFYADLGAAYNKAVQRSTRPAVAISSSTTSRLLIFAIPSSAKCCAPAATIRITSPRSTPRWCGPP